MFCVMCKEEVESQLETLLHCLIAQGIWNNLFRGGKVELWDPGFMSLLIYEEHYAFGRGNGESLVVLQYVSYLCGHCYLKEFRDVPSFFSYADLDAS